MTLSSSKRRGWDLLRLAAVLAILQSASSMLTEVGTAIGAPSDQTSETQLPRSKELQSKSPVTSKEQSIETTPYEETSSTTGFAVECTLRAYSTTDTLDQEHRNSRPSETRYLTATGTDARATAGLAGPRELFGTKVTMYLGNEYVVLTIDDTGGYLRRRVQETGELHLEIRFPSHEEAKNFGVRKAIVTLDKPWPLVESGSNASNGTTESKE